MSIVTDGLRSDKWRPFAKQKLAQLKAMGLLVRNLVVSGYRINLLAMDDIEKARITAPPGAVVVDFTAGKYEYRYADQYGGDFQLTDAHLPAEGNTPRALFSGLDDLMYHGTSDYFNTRGTYGTLTASWYAPRPKFGGDPASTSGYLAGGLMESTTSPSTIPTVGYGYTHAGNFFSASVVLPNSSRWFDEVSVNVVRNALSFTASLPSGTSFPGFRGKAHYLRPVWGENAAVVYAVHNAGVCSDVLGVSHVLVYRQSITTSPFDNAGATLIGQITQNTLATALGLPAPCTGDGAETQLVNAMTNLLGADWPFFSAPYQRGSFSSGLYDVCFWGPVPPSGEVKGVVFSASGTAQVSSIVLPAYDNAVHAPLITEVSPGYYLCEMCVPLAYEFPAIYYGSPFGGWTALTHPPGVILRHRTIEADASGIKALALIYADAITTLYEYDSSRGTGWVSRGKVADGKVERADVAVFGAHKFAHLASSSSPVRNLWL